MEMEGEARGRRGAGFHCGRAAAGATRGARHL
jgi:hypothetical protein